MAGDPCFGLANDVRILWGHWMVASRHFSVVRSLTVNPNNVIAVVWARLA